MSDVTTTLTLAAFLAARLAEDEELARDAALAVGDRGFGDERVERGQVWVSSYHKVCRRRLDDNPGKHVILEGRALGLSAAQHVARHDPARVLAEVAAKRRLVELWSQWDALCSPDDWPEGDMSGAALSDAGRWMLRVAAAVYSDHADYDESWRP